MFEIFHGNKKAESALLLKVAYPRNLEDAQTVVDLIFDDRPVVVNFESTDADKIKQITDFIRGKVFISSCNIEQVSEKLFIFAPRNVKIEPRIVN